MPNQYKNKVVYGDSVLMDITDTTAEAGDVASGAVFYAKNGARTVGTFTQAQSDWNEDDTTDPAFILNKPAIPSNWVNGSAKGSVRTIGSATEDDSYTMGSNAVAEGNRTKASGDYTHAEGWNTIASRSGSHAEGRETSATNTASHAEGVSTVASGFVSHAEGWHTIASSGYQHVQGKYNIEDSNNTYADIVGNGSSSARSNAYTLDWSGNGWFAGKVSAGTIETPASVTHSNNLTTKEYVDNAINRADQNKQGSAIYGSANVGDDNFITPFSVALYTTDDGHRDVIVTYTDSTYGILHFSSWSVAASFGGIVSNAILYYNSELLCATLFGFTSASVSPSEAWIFTVYSLQRALTFDSAPISYSTNPVTSGGIYTALSGKANNADIPSASSSTPLVDGTASAGSSTTYARADHVHPKIPIDSALSTTSENPVQNKVIRNALVNKLDVDENCRPIPLDFPDPENPPATLDGATITCGMDFNFIYELYRLAIDTPFELFNIIQNNNFIVFHPFRINEVDESIELFSIFNGNIYTLTLEPNTNLSIPAEMIGTLHVDAILSEDVKPAFFGGQWINYGLGTANPQYGSHVLLTNYYIDGTLYNTNLLLYAVPDYEISNTSSPLISLYKGYTESGIAITYEKNNSSPYNIWNWDAGEHSISVNQAYVYMPNTVPSASNITPARDGAAKVGTSTNYARADHVHPKVLQTLSMSNNVITLTDSDGRTSSVTLPVYDGTVTSGGGS